MEPSVLLLECGFSTQLTRYVGSCVDGDPLWCSKFLQTNKEACVQTYRDFIRAGVDIIKTNTYQASMEGFKKYLNLDKEESVELYKKSVSYIREAIDLEIGDNESAKRKIMIAGAMGAYGAGLRDGSEYRGDYVESTSASSMAAWHTPRIEALLAAGVDLLAFETIPALAEAELLLSLLKNYPATKAWISFSCKDGEHISHGERLSDVAAKCWAINADQLVGIGVNCLHPSLVSPLLKSVRSQVPHHIPFIVYSNSGETYNTHLGKWEGKDTCVPLVNYLGEWLQLGVKIVGGCCRTGVGDAKQFRPFIDNWLQTNKS